MKIQICKLTVILFSGFVINAGGFFWSRIRAEIYYLCIDRYYCRPVFPIHTDAFVPSSIVRLFPTIAQVFRMSTLAKVAGLIVQRIMVYMVGLHPVWRARYNSVHINQFSLSKQYGRISHGIKRFCAWIIKSIPLILIEFLVPIIRDLCNLSLCQLNQFHSILQKRSRPFGMGKHPKQAGLQNIGLALTSRQNNFTTVMNYERKLDLEKEY